MIHHLRHLFPVQQSLLCVVTIKYGEIKSILRAVEHNFKIDGSMNQSIKQSINLPINQSTNQTIKQTNTPPTQPRPSQSYLPTYLPVNAIDASNREKSSSYSVLEPADTPIAQPLSCSVANTEPLHLCPTCMSGEGGGGGG